MKAVLIAAAAIGIAVAPAQASHHPAMTQHSRATALLARVNVAASEFKYVLSAKTAKRGVVTFRVTNLGKINHDFAINGRKTRLLAHGQSATLRVVFLRKGHYPYRCTVPGHAVAGMKGVFTVT
jgi:uncharacterized cupredoxin-like copper-binding protein